MIRFVPSSALTESNMRRRVVSRILGGTGKTIRIGLPDIGKLCALETIGKLPSPSPAEAAAIIRLRLFLFKFLIENVS
jgi:hypothetical protein